MGQFSVGMVQNGTFGVGQSDNREHNRRRVLQSGKLIFNNGVSLFDCVVRNMSAKGALVEIDDPNFLPSSFEFKLSDSHEKVKAKAVWKKNRTVGISYA
ncbi:MAG: PilZ domain-containing protein [Nitratireductor sp.]